MPKPCTKHLTGALKREWKAYKHLWLSGMVMIVACSITIAAVADQNLPLPVCMLVVITITLVHALSTGILADFSRRADQYRCLRLRFSFLRGKLLAIAILAAPPTLLFWLTATFIEVGHGTFWAHVSWLIPAMLLELAILLHLSGVGMKTTVGEPVLALFLSLVIMRTIYHIDAASSLLSGLVFATLLATGIVSACSRRIRHKVAWTVLGSALTLSIIHTSIA